MIINDPSQYVCKHATLWVTTRGVVEAASPAVVKVCSRLSVQEFFAAASRQTHNDVGLFGAYLWL